jgi:uncharacterized protein
MKKTCVLLLVWLFCMALGGESYAVEMGIITGREKGTYYQFGLDLKQLVQNHGIELNVAPSTGDIENIYAVYKRPGIPMGFVQADLLAFVAKVQTNPLLKLVAKKIKLIFPLYDNEVHVVARKGISSFDDLAGQRVAIGEEGSGTYLTSKLLFEVAKVNPKEMLPIGSGQALAQLKAGTIDAMVYAVGAPAKLFQEDVTEADNLQLIPIINESIRQFYPGITIPPNTYSWQKSAVPTVGVKAVLVSFDFRTEQCENVGRFAQIVAENMDWLRQNGHPKWKQVDLNATLKGWEQYDCVRKHMPKPKGLDPTQVNPVLEAIREILR